MRTTITISEQLYCDAKAHAAQTSRTVSAVIEDAVREALHPKLVDQIVPLELPVFGGSGVLPGVEVSSIASLRDLMDADTAVDALR